MSDGGASGALSGFAFHAPTAIRYGRGEADGIVELGRSLGSSVLVVTGAEAGRQQRIVDGLARAGLRLAIHAVAGEPTLTAVEEARQRGRMANARWVLGIGGGSALDTAKAAAGLMLSRSRVLDHLEVIGEGRRLGEPGVPLVAVPTTAGTGAEVTRNAVIASPVHRLKVSLRSPHLFAHTAILDPLLLTGAPRRVAVAAGLDAVTQLLEAFLSRRAGPLTDALCREGLARAAGALEAVVDGDGAGDVAVMERLGYAALLSGIVLTQAGLGVVHGLAGVLGGRLPAASHGVICGRLLGPGLRANLAAAPATVGPRLEEAARLLLGAGHGTDDLAAWAEGLAERGGLARLAALGLAEGDAGEVVTAARRANSMKSNPVDLDEGALAGVLRAAW